MICTNIIDQLLARLDTTFKSPSDLVQAMNACVHELAELGPECSTSLVQAAHDTLNHINEDLRHGEPVLYVILMALVHRHQQDAVDIAGAALHSKRTEDKEFYVGILEGIPDRSVTEVLLQFLRDLPHVDETQSDMRARIIHALFAHDTAEARALVTTFADDPNPHVRNEALEYLFELDVREAASLFVSRLLAEDDPYNLEYLIKGVVHWQRHDALPTLRQLAATEWVQGDEDLAAAVAGAITELALYQQFHKVKV